MKTFIIAEVSANHGQSLDTAIRMIKKARECGVDAVKFQCYTPDTVTIDSDNKYFRIKHAKWGGQTLYELYGKAYTPWKWFKKLKKAANDLGLVFFATAFDKTSVDFLEAVGVPFHKIASFELVDLPLIEYAARTGKPLIMSVGMAAVQEINEAVAAAKRSGAKDVTLLKCVSAYPADPLDMNLRTIVDMKKRFGCKVGLSDHTMGTGASIAAVTLGATVIEKHFILSRRMKTPDAFFSMEPDELKDLVDNIRIIEKALGRVHYGLSEGEKTSRIFRRSLFAVRDIRAGEALTEANIRSIRPANGLKPKYLKTILDKRAKRSIKRGTPLAREMIS
ncbi:MAG: pseudaminic acid synthase [Candidatus Omnitrophica bacterium]|nr:pseudaminic acid synthase [Candidatus Omnitrophota bacterium]